MLLLKVVAFTLLVPGSVTVLIPYLLLRAGGGVPPLPLGDAHAAGLVPILLGAALYLWCAWDFARTGRGTPSPSDPLRRLVVRCLYRYVRNPMYVGVVAILAGEALLFGSILLLGYAAAALLAFHARVVLYEEPHLRTAFGSEFERYRQAVPRWVPRRTRT